MNFIAVWRFWPEFLIFALLFLIFIQVSGILGVVINWLYKQQINTLKLSKKVKGKRCLVTGGSSGLGLALSIELLKAGASVTIVARGKVDPSTKKSSLEDVVKDLKKYLVGKTQNVDYISCDLTKYSSCLELAYQLLKQGKSPEYVFALAGSSIPGFIADQLPKLADKGENAHEWMIESNYFTAVNLTRALIKASVVDEDEPLTAGISKNSAKSLPSHFVFCGSMLSTISMIGYSAYSGRYFKTISKQSLYFIF